MRIPGPVQIHSCFARWLDGLRMHAAPYVFLFLIQVMIHCISVTAKLRNPPAVSFVHIEYILSKVFVRGEQGLEK
jgi:hypothetical protein